VQQISPTPVSDAPVLVLEDKIVILEQAVVLEEFALSCHQPGAFRWLEYFLEDGWRWKRVSLVLVLAPHAQPGPLQASHLLGAVLFLEYLCLGMRTRMAVNKEVVAPENLRGLVAGMAVQAMLDRGAHAICASYEWSEDAPNQPWLHLRRDDVQWALKGQDVRRQMALGATYDETLARLGKTTRRNLRYYRRRLEARVACVFLADARGIFTEDDAAEMNRVSLNPIREDLCRRRHRGCFAPEAFLVALRSTDGQWLSAMGGWRYGSTTIIHWQTNRSGHQADSLVTVMRAYFLESEVERGTSRIIFQYGTTHSMSHSFDPEYSLNFIVRRRSLYSELLRASAHLRTRIGKRISGLPGEENPLRDALRSHDLHWHSASSAPTPSASRWSGSGTRDDRSAASVR